MDQNRDFIQVMGDIPGRQIPLESIGMRANLTPLPKGRQPMTVATTTTVPITQDRDGGFRVGGTRVPLDAVVSAFMNGASAEEIVEDFPELDLADVYATIAYYLRHREETDEYLDHRRAEAQAVREKIENRYPVRGLRERLLARRKVGE